MRGGVRGFFLLVYRVTETKTTRVLRGRAFARACVCRRRAVLSLPTDVGRKECERVVCTLYARARRPSCSERGRADFLRVPERGYRTRREMRRAGPRCVTAGDSARLGSRGGKTSGFYTRGRSWNAALRLATARAASKSGDNGRGVRESFRSRRILGAILPARKSRLILDIFFG